MAKAGSSYEKQTGVQKSRWTVPLSSKNLTPCSVSLRGIDFFKLAHLKDKIKMLAYIKIVQMYFFKFNIIFQSKDRPAKPKFLPACSVSQRGVRVCAVLVSTESLISRISLGKRIFQQTILACLSGAHAGGFDSLKKF